MAYPETDRVLDYHFSRWGADAVYADPNVDGAETPLRVIVDSAEAGRESGAPGAGLTLTRPAGHVAQALWYLRFRIIPTCGLRRGAVVRVTGPADNPYAGSQFKLEAPVEEEDVVCPMWVVMRLA